MDIDKPTMANGISSYTTSNNFERNPIINIMQLILNSEQMFEKFQQIFERYPQESDSIIKDFSLILTTQTPDSLSLDDIECKALFRRRLIYCGLRFITEVSSKVRRKSEIEDVSFDKHFCRCCKLLLYHSLTSKIDSANIALLELQQLCRLKNCDLRLLFQTNEKLILRTIVIAILDIMPSTESQSIQQFDVCKHIIKSIQLFNVTSISLKIVTQLLVITMKLIAKGKYIQKVEVFLTKLAARQEKDLLTYMSVQIHHLLIYVLFERKMSTFDIDNGLQILAKYCSTSPSDLLMSKLNIIKSRIILAYQKDPKFVTDSIYYIAKFEMSESDMPFEEEFENESLFVEYLMPSFVGILLGLDEHFVETKQTFGSSESISEIESLCKILSSMNMEHVKKVHVKLLSTLSLLLKLRTDNTNYALNISLIKIWRIFLDRIPIDVLKLLFVNICAALNDLLHDCPKEAAQIYEHMFSPKNIKLLDSETLECLFFLPDLAELKDVLELIKPKIRKSNLLNKLDELDDALRPAIALTKHENERCHYFGLIKIRDVLKSNLSMIRTAILINPDQPLDKNLCFTIETLLRLCSLKNSSGLSALISECLGLIGAINPARLDHLIYNAQATQSSQKINLNFNGPEFVINLFEMLKYSLFSDVKDESETASYVLQVVGNIYSVSKSKTILQYLSSEAKRAWELCENTNYRGFKVSQKGDSSMSVFERFKKDQNYSYNDYLDKFSQTYLTILNNEKIKNTLQACTYLYKYNLTLAEYLLPTTIVYLLLNQPSDTDIIKRELIAIVEHSSGLATQEFDSAHARDNSGCNDQTLNFQCAFMVFNLLDVLNWIICDEMKKKVPDRKYEPKQLKDIQNFLDSIPKDQLAILASKCRSHARALSYIEQYLFKHRTKFDQFAALMQRIYVELNDPYEAGAVEMIRTSQASIIDEISTNEACGRYDRAFSCSLVALDSVENQTLRMNLIFDSLRSLSRSGDYHRLYEKSLEFMTRYPNLEEDLIPSAIEATWKLSRWDELDRLMPKEKENFLDNTAVAQGALLNSFIKGEGRLDDCLKIVRHQQIKPLSISMMDRSAYIRGYQSLLVFHMLSDFDLFAYNFRTPNDDIEILMDTTTESQVVLNEVIQIWNERSMLIQPTLKNLEPLLEWQRAMINLVATKQKDQNKRVYHQEIGKLWLRSTELAREAGNHERAVSSLTETKRWLFSNEEDAGINILIKYQIEKSKIHWDAGEKTLAIRSLNKTLKRLSEHPLNKHLCERQSELYQRNQNLCPDLTKPSSCSKCTRINPSERASFANLKIMLTYYSEEAAAALPESIFYMYEECVHLGVNQEETYFRLARYYDRLYAYYLDNPQLCGEQDTKAELDDRYEPPTQRYSQVPISGGKEEVYAKLMESSITAFGMSLVYGVKYIRESMPRLLNIWYDLGARKGKSNQVTTTRTVISHIESSIRFIDTLMHKVKPYYFMSALSLLLSRICHPYTGINKKTSDILTKLLAKYPDQLTWHLIAVLHDDNSERKKTAANLINTAKKNSDLIKIVKGTLDFSEVIKEICINYSPYGHTKGRLKSGSLPLKKISPLTDKFNSNPWKVMMPTQESLYAVFPLEEVKDENYDVFSRCNVAYVNKFDQECVVFHSQQQPRRIFLHCDDGQKRGLLCKPGDDLRKDNRCMEFFNLVNRLLRRDNQSNARFFEIQTFLVLPLSSTSGILEWVPDLQTLRSIVDAIYKERNPNFSLTQFYPKRTREYTPEEQRTMFCNDILPRMQPPALPTWFLRNHNEPSSWYMARLAFTRSSAVISMAGYIIGLGDRHLDNVLIDTINGRTVHVDFNLLFHQGETLMVPERVPFRLTHNLTAAFGSLGYEGNFRKASEITMRVMRNEKDALLTTLKPFIHDPCADWIRYAHTKGDDKNKFLGNWPAQVKIQITERKLKGFPRSRKFKPLTLIDSYSVEAQVDNLIEESSDIYNLCQMYNGWCPHV